MGLVCTELRADDPEAIFTRDEFKELAWRLLTIRPARWAGLFSRGWAAVSGQDVFRLRREPRDARVKSSVRVAVPKTLSEMSVSSPKD